MRKKTLRAGTNLAIVGCMLIIALMPSASMAAKCFAGGKWHDYGDPACTGRSSKAPRGPQSESSSHLANPVCAIPKARVESDLKKNLVSKYAPNYGAVELLLSRGIQSYENLCAIRVDSEDVKILESLLSRYYPSIGTVDLLYKRNRESYDRLRE